MLGYDESKYITIPANADLNSLIEPGVYCCHSASNAQTIVNCPFKFAFKLIVEQVSGDEAIVSQKIFSGNYMQFIPYIRTRNSAGNWGEWYQFVTKSDLMSTAPQTIRSQCSYSKSGNVVTVSCQGLKTEIPANTWTALFTMPVGCRPNFNIHSVAAFASDGSKTGLVRVTTSGECSVFSKELTTVSWFTVSFLVDT